MPSIRSLLLNCLLLTRISFYASASSATTDKDEEETKADLAAFQRLLDQVDPPALHAALHNYSPRKFKHGVFQEDRTAVEAVHRDDAPLATTIVSIAKRQDQSNNVTAVVTINQISTTITEIAINPSTVAPNPVQPSDRSTQQATPVPLPNPQTSPLAGSFIPVSPGSPSSQGAPPSPGSPSSPVAPGSPGGPSTAAGSPNQPSASPGSPNNPASPNNPVPPNQPSVSPGSPNNPASPNQPSTSPGSPNTPGSPNQPSASPGAPNSPGSPGQPTAGPGSPTTTAGANSPGQTPAPGTTQALPSNPIPVTISGSGLSVPGIGFVTSGQVITTVNAAGVTVVTTIDGGVVTLGGPAGSTPTGSAGVGDNGSGSSAAGGGAGGVQTNLILHTTTLPDGSQSTITAVTVISGAGLATPTGSAGATSPPGTTTGPSGSLQSAGLAPRSRSWGWEVVGVMGGAVGFAFML